jgi:hypothetical protein
MSRFFNATTRATTSDIHSNKQLKITVLHDCLNIILIETQS